MRATGTANDSPSMIDTKKNVLTASGGDTAVAWATNLRLLNAAHCLPQKDLCAASTPNFEFRCDDNDSDSDIDSRWSRLKDAANVTVDNPLCCLQHFIRLLVDFGPSTGRHSARHGLASIL